MPKFYDQTNQEYVDFIIMDSSNMGVSVQHDDLSLFGQTVTYNVLIDVSHSQLGTIATDFYMQDIIIIWDFIELPVEEECLYSLETYHTVFKSSQS